MFCRFGCDDESRPVAATAWLKLQWMRPVSGWTKRRQRVDVRALELGELPVREDLARQLVRERELLEHGLVGREAGLGLLGRRQRELLEEDHLQLLGRADVELLARERVDALLGRGVELLLEALAERARASPRRCARPPAPCARARRPAAPRARGRARAARCARAPSRSRQQRVLRAPRARRSAGASSASADLVERRGAWRPCRSAPRRACRRGPGSARERSRAARRAATGRPRTPRRSSRTAAPRARSRAGRARAARPSGRCRSRSARRASNSGRSASSDVVARGAAQRHDRGRVARRAERQRQQLAAQRQLRLERELEREHGRVGEPRGQRARPRPGSAASSTRDRAPPRRRDTRGVVSPSCSSRRFSSSSRNSSAERVAVGLGQRHRLGVELDRQVVAQARQLAREPRHVGAGAQRLARALRRRSRPGCASSASSEPCARSSSAAPFSPMPFTPGMLSDESPISERRSSICAGGTP